MNPTDFEAQCRETLSAPLDTEHVGRNIVAFNSIDSTNTYGLEHGTDGMVVVADCQTAGRGRRGRKWLSDPGVGLWFTVCFAGLKQGLTFAGALAVETALRDRCDARIKWPNDILIDGHKVCGILVEHRNDRTVLGIGLNVHQRPEDFPDDLIHRAGSLESIAGGSWDRLDLLRAILMHLDQKVILLESGEYSRVRQEWADACAIIGKQIRRDGVTGDVRAIDNQGALVVDTGDGEEVILSGEIEILAGED